MAKARVAIQDLKRDVVKWSTVKRNLDVILGGPRISAVDTDGIRERKAKRAKMCLALRQAGHAVVLAWAVSFPLSSWEEMPQAVFQELVRRVSAEGTDELPPKARATICALAGDEPLCEIKVYGEFVKWVEGLAMKPSGHTATRSIEALVGEITAVAEHRPQKKRRLDDGGNTEVTPLHPTLYDEMSPAGSSAATVDAMPWAGGESVDLLTDMGIGLHLSSQNMPFDVPDELVQDLFNHREPHSVSLAVPFSEFPATVTFLVARQFAVEYSLMICRK